MVSQPLCKKQFRPHVLHHPLISTTKRLQPSHFLVRHPPFVRSSRAPPAGFVRSSSPARTVPHPRPAPTSNSLPTLAAGPRRPLPSPRSPRLRAAAGRPRRRASLATDPRPSRPTARAAAGTTPAPSPVTGGTTSPRRLPLLATTLRFDGAHHRIRPPVARRPPRRRLLLATSPLRRCLCSRKQPGPLGASSSHPRRAPLLSRRVEVKWLPPRGVPVPLRKEAAGRRQLVTSLTIYSSPRTSPSQTRSPASRIPCGIVTLLPLAVLISGLNRTKSIPNCRFNFRPEPICYT